MKSPVSYSTIIDYRRNGTIQMRIILYLFISLDKSKIGRINNNVLL